MRVGLVCPYSLSVPGGVQGQVLGLARAVRRLGHDVRVIAPTDGAPPEPGITSVGESIPFAANGSVAPVAPDMSAAIRALRAAGEEKFDVIHVHEPFVPGPALTITLAKPAPLVGTFHAVGGFAMYRMGGPLMRVPASRLDVRCVVSEDAQKLVGGFVRGPFEMMWNGIDVARYADVTPWPSDRPTIFFVGRHEPRKGLAVLLDAAADLPADVDIWIGGHGPETEALQELHAGDARLSWLGRLDDLELRRRLRAADVFCAPSLGGESFGIVLLEAMAAGTPIVAGDNPGYRKVARDGRDGLLVEPGDARGLGAAINRLLGDDQLAEGLVISGEERAAGFSMDRLAARYVELYEQAIKK